MKLLVMNAVLVHVQLNNKGIKMELTFKVTEQEANVILAGLQELPAKVANPMMRKLQEQAQEQLPPKETE